MLGVSEGDFHRSRLTHSMETANIGRGLVQTLAKDHRFLRKWLPSADLIEAICLAHDLGHPPFGHNGEIALNAMAYSVGGFEANGQTLRILSFLERKRENWSLDLMRRTLLGILKYPAPYRHLVTPKLNEAISQLLDFPAAALKPPKCYLDCDEAVVDWILAPLSESDRSTFQTFQQAESDKHARARFKSLDAAIMELADDIAYAVHDVEDGIALDLINQHHLDGLRPYLQGPWAKRWKLGNVIERLFPGGEEVHDDRKWIFGGIVHALISSVTVTERESFEAPLLRWNATLPEEARGVVDEMKKVALENVINLQSVQTLEYRGRYLIKSLFQALESDPIKLIPSDFTQIIETQQVEPKRAICDYISGMSDSFATRMYERLFVPRLGSVFEKL